MSVSKKQAAASNKTGAPVAAGVAVAAIVVVAVLAIFMLFRAATAKEEAKVDANSTAIQGMKGIFQNMQTKMGQPRGAGGGR